MPFAAVHESKRVPQTCQTCRDRSPSRGRFGAARKARFQYRGAVRTDRDHPPSLYELRRGTTLCFECCRSELSRQRALRLADVISPPPLRSPFKRTGLSALQIAHRRAMLAHFQGGTGQRRAAM